VAADAEQLGAAVFLGTKAGEPFRAVQHDERHIAQRLDVVDRGRALVKTGHCGERRLDAGLCALPLERFDERRLLAGFVRPGAAVHVNIAVEAAAENVAAKIPGLIRALDLRFQNLLNVIELAANIDVGDLCADRVAGDRATLDKEVRVALHQNVVLEGARLAFIRVTADVLRPGRVLEDELPFHPGWKAGAAAAAQPRGLHLLDDVVRLQRQRFSQPLVSTLTLQVEVERVGIRLVDVLGQDRLVRHLPASSFPLLPSRCR
jgi:hypothetical protein